LKKVDSSPRFYLVALKRALWIVTFLDGFQTLPQMQTMVWPRPGEEIIPLPVIPLLLYRSVVSATSLALSGPSSFTGKAVLIS